MNSPVNYRRRCTTTKNGLASLLTVAVKDVLLNSDSAE